MLEQQKAKGNNFKSHFWNVKFAHNFLVHEQRNQRDNFVDCFIVIETVEIIESIYLIFIEFLWILAIWNIRAFNMPFKFESP